MSSNEEGVSMRSVHALLAMLTTVVPFTADAVTVNPSAWWPVDAAECEAEPCFWNEATWGWILFDSSGNVDSPPLGFPDANRFTYIVDSEHESIRDVGTVSLDSTASTGNLYIGGWKPDFDDLGHGDPTTKDGRLRILQGAQLTVSEATPICHYTRVGNRGIGVVEQSGGTVRSCNTITMGWDSADSLGIWTHTGGLIHTFGFDVGMQGSAFLDLRGGEVEPLDLSDPAGAAWQKKGISRVGGAYELDHSTYSPGVGFVNVRGGKYKAYDLMVGLNTGGVGVVAVRNAAVGAPSLSEVKVEAPAPPFSPGWNAGGFYVGWNGGTGVITQSGGYVEAGWMTLGHHARSFGQYVIEGGQLRQKNGNSNNKAIQLGNPSETPENPGGGVGNLTIVGAGTLLNPIFIDIDGDYYQGSRSSLTLVLDRGYELSGWVAYPIAQIAVDTKATFAPGSILDIRVALNDEKGSTNDPAAANVAYTVPVGTTYTILSAPTIDGTPTCTAETLAAGWRAKKTTTATKRIQIAYCPGSSPGGSCSNFPSGCFQ